MNIDWSRLNYPHDAAQVRDLIREMLRSQVDEGSSMDTGGGMGSADLWASFGGVEYVITVQRPKASSLPIPELSDEEHEANRRAMEEQMRRAQEGGLIVPPRKP